MLIEGPDAGIQEREGEHVGAHVDGVASNSGMGIIEEDAAAGGGKMIDVPTAGGIGRLGDGQTVAGTIGINAQNVAVGGLIVNGVGVEDAGTVGVGRHEAVEGGWSDERVAALVIDFQSHVNHGNNVIRADSQFWIGWNIAATTAAFVVIYAVEVGAQRWGKGIGAVGLLNGFAGQQFGRFGA